MLHNDTNTVAYWMELLADVEHLSPTELLDPEYVTDRYVTNVDNQKCFGPTSREIVDGAAVLSQLLVLSGLRFDRNVVREHIAAHLKATYGDCTPTDYNDIDDYIESAEDETDAVWGAAPYDTLDGIASDFLLYRQNRN